MARYIDAENLNFEGQNYNKSQMKAILDFVDAQPTAYDVDAVVAQLGELQKTNFEAYEVATHIPDKIGYINTSNAYANAINIVKRSGLE